MKALNVLPVLPGQQLHNVRFVQFASRDGTPVLVVQHDDMTYHVIAAYDCAPHAENKVGYLVRATPPIGTPRIDLSEKYWFYEYPDQSLRRVPELDWHQHTGADVIGWVCDAKPRGFRAPIGLIPGENGQFISADLTTISLDVPSEFVELCRDVALTPLDVLRGFIADVCGLQNLIVRPRADGFSSNGSDERMYAEQWFDRAYDMRREDAAQWRDALDQEEDREVHRDNLMQCLDDYLDAGGNADTFIDQVEKIVQQRRPYL